MSLHFNACQMDHYASGPHEDRYASEADHVEELCKSEGYDHEKLSDYAKEKLAIILMAPADECRAIAYLKTIFEEESTFCTFCGSEIFDANLARKEEKGWIHDVCAKHCIEDEAGARVFAFTGYVIAAYIVVMLFIRFGITWSAR